MILAVALLGCVSDERISEAHQSLGQASADGVGLALVLTEWTRHVQPAADFRHDNDCGCPCTEAIGIEDSYVNELDYAAPACVPWSGVLPASTTGHIWLDVNQGALNIDRVQATIGQELASADVSGDVLDPGGSVSMAGEVAVGQVAANIDIDIHVRGDVLVIDGSVSTDDQAMTWEGVTLSMAQTSSASACAAPLSGTVTTDEGSIEYESEATIAWKSHTSSYDRCEWQAPFLLP